MYYIKVLLRVNFSNSLNINKDNIIVISTF